MEYVVEIGLVGSWSEVARFTTEREAQDYAGRRRNAEGPGGQSAPGVPSVSRARFRVVEVKE